MAKHIHNGIGAVRPYIFGRPDLLEFVKEVFAAVELERNAIPNGLHVQARIGDSVVVLAVSDPPYSEATRASVYVYVEDVDATYQRALAMGATSMSAPTERPWRGRTAGVKDGFGNVWYIETYHGAD
jgi:uncharacterized glyoxalase superfamily protein PhnB